MLYHRKSRGVVAYASQMLTNSTPVTSQQSCWYVLARDNSLRNISEFSARGYLHMHVRKIMKISLRMSRGIYVLIRLKDLHS